MINILHSLQSLELVLCTPGLNPPHTTQDCLMSAMATAVNGACVVHSMPPEYTPTQSSPAYHKFRRSELQARDRKLLCHCRRLQRRCWHRLLLLLLWFCWLGDCSIC
jgi:hypothetical protein